MAHHRRVALVCVALIARARGLLPPRPRSRRLTVLRASPELESLPRGDLIARCRELAAENAALRATLSNRTAPALEPSSSRTARAPRFALGLASLAAGFAFESYNEPDGARWERGADGCDVAFLSAPFVRSCYAGALVARVIAADGLPDQRDLQEVALTGARSDPYVTLAVLEAPLGTASRAAASRLVISRAAALPSGTRARREAQPSESAPRRTRQSRTAAARKAQSHPRSG